MDTGGHRSGAGNPGSRDAARARAPGPELAQRVAAAYDALWDRPPPQRTPREREEAAAAETHARRRGWAPPLAWDDEEIDLQDARPAEGWKRSGRTSVRSADLAEDVAWLREQDGYSLRQ